MTVLEAQGKLLDYFIENSLFNFKKHYKMLETITDNDDFENRSIIRFALEDLVKSGVLYYSGNSLGEKEFWVLSKPLAAFSQNIELSGNTILGLARLVNNYCAKTNELQMIVNPLNIKDTDIQKVLIMLDNSLNFIDKKEGEKDS